MAVEIRRTEAGRRKRIVMPATSEFARHRLPGLPLRMADVQDFDG